MFDNQLIDWIPWISTDSYEEIIIQTSIYLGVLFFFVQSVVTLYLKPETVLERLITYKSISLFLVFTRVWQSFYFPDAPHAAVFGAIVWTNLSLSFVVAMNGILKSTFGKRGRGKALRNQLA
jgi:hypothetical protein